MNTETLIIEVIDTEADRRQEYTFDRSPVRLGRSPLNDLPIERSFVSHCHGVLNFDDTVCSFMDLGSLNGTFLGAARITGHQQVLLAPDSCLRIGSLELRVRRESSPLLTRKSYAFSPSAIDVPLSPSPRASAPSQAAMPRSTARALTPPDELASMFSAYRQSWRVLLDACTQQLAHSTDREGAVSQLLERFPELAQEAEFRRWLGTDRPSVSLVPPGPPSSARPPPSPAGATSEPRASRVLERFAQSFIELRRGQAQFAREVSVTTERSDPISKIDDARTLVAYLLDTSASTSKLDELSRAYADIMLHQVALLSGLRAGARQLLDELRPEELGIRLAGSAKSWLMRLLGRDARWEATQRRLSDLSEESTLSGILLGSSFARAYAMAMGQSEPSSGSKKHPKAHQR